MVLNGVVDVYLQIKTVCMIASLFLIVLKGQVSIYTLTSSLLVIIWSPSLPKLFGVVVLDAVRGVVRGGVWLYLRSLVNNLVGFFYWLVISAVAGAGVVGLTSATVSLAVTVFGLVSLGIDVGVQRFIGFCRGRGDDACSARYFWSTALFRIVVYVVVGLLLVVLGLLGFSFGGVGGVMFFYAGVLVVLNSSLVFDSLLVSYLWTRSLFLSALLGQVARFPVGVGLVLAGWGWVGAFIGFLVPPLVGWFVKLWYALRIVKPVFRVFFGVLREVLVAGLASWVPSVVMLLGQQLGVLFLFGVRGAVETGRYYVAFAVMNVVLGIGLSILQLLLPVLSGMRDGRKRAAARAIRLSLAIVVPLAFALAVYSRVPLSLLGRGFAEASPILMVLALSIPATFISLGVNNLVYAYGLYWLVLFLGLSMNVSRIATYIPFSAWWGGLGTALSYALGSYIALITAVYICRRISFNPGFREAVLAVLPPLGLAGILYYTHIYWLIGAPVLLIASYVFYFKVKVMTRQDLRDLAYALTSKKIADKAYQYLQPIIDWLTS